MTTLSAPVHNTSAGAEPIANPNMILVVCIIASTFAAVFMRFALNEGMHPLLIGAGRLLIATIAYTPMVWMWHRPTLAKMSRPALLYSIAAGVFLGLHFISMIASLQKTNVLVNQVFINMGPVVVALLEMFFFKVRQSRAVWFGIGVSVIGGLIIAFGNPGSTQANDNLLLGSALALLGCVMGSFYMVIGRRVRAELPVIPYVWIVFGTGTITALTATLISGVPVTGYTPNAYFWVLMVALIPQLVGHSGYNYLMGYFSPTFISLVNLSIVVTSAILAYILFHEVPGIAQQIGSAVIIIGVSLAIMGKNRGAAVKGLWGKVKQGFSHA